MTALPIQCGSTKCLPARLWRADCQVLPFERIGARIIAAYTADPRFIPQETKPASKGDPHGPYLLAATAQGQVLRTPYLPYREASTVKGRMFARLNDDDKVVLAAVALNEFKSMILCSQEGRVIHFPISDIPVLAGVGKGVMGIKLDDKDVVPGRGDDPQSERSAHRRDQWRQDDGVLWQQGTGQPGREGLRSGKADELYQSGGVTDCVNQLG